MTMHSLVGPAAIGASNGSAKKSSLLRRLYDAVIAHRTAQAEEQVARLDLPMMQPTGRAGPPLGTAFTVSIEARTGVTTGISSADRAHTILTAVGDDARPVLVREPTAQGAQQAGGKNEGGRAQRCRLQRDVAVVDVVFRQPGR